MIADDLLGWYDTHARVLPWRMPPDSGPADPYRVWLSEVMLQQTTVAAVKEYFNRFTSLWPQIEDLAAAEDAQIMAEWAGLGYYARARNLLACAREVRARGGFPRSRAELQKLPGIGPYTSAAVAAIAFDQPETVVDGNVERVVSRLFAIETPLPKSKPEIGEKAEILTPDKRPGDYAQAMMDLGATICTPRNPACGICPINHHCAARKQGIATELPKKLPKAPKPVRHGTSWVVRSRDAILLETRPTKGLLGGTLAFPSTDWDGQVSEEPISANWIELGKIKHIFTHFELHMTVKFAISDTQNPSRGFWQPLAQFDPKALPGLMRKVWSLATANARLGDGE